MMTLVLILLAIAICTWLIMQLPMQGNGRMVVAIVAVILAAYFVLRHLGL